MKIATTFRFKACQNSTFPNPTWNTKEVRCPLSTFYSDYSKMSLSVLQIYFCSAGIAGKGRREQMVGFFCFFLAAGQQCCREWQQNKSTWWTTLLLNSIVLSLTMVVYTSFMNEVGACELQYEFVKTKANYFKQTYTWLVSFNQET